MPLQPSVPCYDFGDQTFLTGVPAVREVKRGGAHELGLPELAPSWLAPRPLLPAPGDGGGNRIFRGLKTCSRARVSLSGLSLAASEAETGVDQWGFPCPQVI